ncbi:putative ribonuclease H-like domain-containing protein [Tanacetum coccineum]
MANLFPNDDANALVPNFNIGFVPNPGHAHFANNNNNGWIEWDVPLGGMDEPMVDPEFDEEDDEDDDGDVVDAPNPSIYEVGGPSTAIVAQPQVIDDLYREVDKLRGRQGALARTIVEGICDNGTEFKNYAMNELCAKKGIKKGKSPSVKENQVIVDAGTQDSYVVGLSGKDKGPTQEYILLPLQPHRTRIPIQDVVQDAQEQPFANDSLDKDIQDSEDVIDKEEQHQMPEDEQVWQDEHEMMVTQELVANAMNDVTRQAFKEEKRRIASQKKVAQATSTNQLSTDRLFVSTDRSNTPNVSTASTSIGAHADESLFVYLGGKIPIAASTIPNADLPIDPNMYDLEDGLFQNMDKNTIAGQSFPYTQNSLRIIQKDNFRNPTSAVQTRRVDSKNRGNQAVLSLCIIYGISCLSNRDVKCFLLWHKIGEEERVVKALYGIYQAHRAWYETLSSFLLENGFRRDVMHKRFQMSSMGELTFFLGLQVKQQPDGIFISQDKYVADILKKFDFWSIRTATTPIESNKPLVKDEDGEDVDVHVYRSMIGSLMYLTASRPDIMFAVCACARFQVTPKASHLNAVKRIFRYLKHQPKLGLWYPRDSPFELEAFSDSDYGGASLDRKSTTGGCQFLGRRLISWQCKKQTIVANSTTKAEYVAAANCCGQVLWIQNQMMDYGFNFMNTRIHIDNESTISVIKNPVAHSRTKHIEIRFHFIRDCYEKRLIEVVKIHTDSNVADLLTKGFDVTRFNFLVVSIGMLNL